MTSSTPYTVEIPSTVWLFFKNLTPELRARVRAELDTLAAELAAKDARGGAVLTVVLPDGHSGLVVVDHVERSLTLKEVKHAP